MYSNLLSVGALEMRRNIWKIETQIKSSGVSDRGGSKPLFVCFYTLISVSCLIHIL